MRTNMFRLFVALFVATNLPISAQAGGRCPAGDSGCTIDNAPARIRERVTDGAKEVMVSDTLRERTKKTKSTLKDCVQCGMDAIEDGVGKITGKAQR